MPVKLVLNNIVPATSPVNGWVVGYRVKGTTGGYIENYYATQPINITTTDPAGTLYEGWIKSDCGGGFFSDEYTWTTYCSCAIGYSITEEGTSCLKYEEDIQAPLFNGNYVCPANWVLEGSGTDSTCYSVVSIPCNENCAEPTNVTVTNKTQDSATITWEPSTTADTTYSVQYMAATDSTWSAPIPVGNALTYTFTSLLPDTLYFAQVLSNCPTGVSIQSLPVNFYIGCPLIYSANITYPEITKLQIDSIVTSPLDPTQEFEVGWRIKEIGGSYNITTYPYSTQQINITHNEVRVIEGYIRVKCSETSFGNSIPFESPCFCVDPTIYNEANNNCEYIESQPQLYSGGCPSGWNLIGDMCVRTFTTNCGYNVCLPPLNITASDITQYTIKLDWTNIVSGYFYNISYKNMTTNAVNVVNGINTTTYTLGDTVDSPALTPNTQYEITITTNCGSDFVSAYPIYETTLPLSDPSCPITFNENVDSVVTKDYSLSCNSGNVNITYSVFGLASGQQAKVTALYNGTVLGSDTQTSNGYYSFQAVGYAPVSPNCAITLRYEVTQIPAKQIQTSTLRGTYASEACGYTTSPTYYVYQSAPNVPVTNGTYIIFTDSGLTQRLDGGNTWYKFFDGTNYYAIQVNYNGVVINMQQCAQYNITLVNDGRVTDIITNFHDNCGDGRSAITCSTSTISPSEQLSKFTNRKGTIPLGNFAFSILFASTFLTSAPMKRREFAVYEYDPITNITTKIYSNLFHYLVPAQIILKTGIIQIKAGKRYVISLNAEKNNGVAFN